MSKYVDKAINPIAEARMAATMSLKQLSRQLGMSAQYISSVEHGTYSNVNERLTAFAAEQLMLTPGGVMMRYKDFQKDTRRRSAREINPKMLTRGLSVASGHVIFQKWRAEYWSSPVAFANAFCVHPEVVRTYEDGSKGSIPGQVERALRSVKLFDPNWSENPSSNAAPAQRTAKLSEFGPVAKKQIAAARNENEALAIRLPEQRSQEPF